MLALMHAAARMQELDSLFKDVHIESVKKLSVTFSQPSEGVECGKFSEALSQVLGDYRKLIDHRRPRSRSWMGKAAGWLKFLDDNGLLRATHNTIKSTSPK